MLRNLDKWAPEAKHWNAIVFNAGLHDVQFSVPLDQYRDNLHHIVGVLRARCDRLYFCSLTPGRADVPPWTPEAVARYNAVALDVMAQERIPVIDLYGEAMRHREWWLKGDIHYTDEGYKHMAEYVKHSLTP